MGTHSSNDNVIELRDVSKRFYGTEALKGVTLNFKRNAIHGIIGQNGAGKSTLMNILMGIHQPDSGSLIYNGQSIKNLNILQRQELGIGMVHQEINVFPNLNVARNVYASRPPRTRYGTVDYGVIERETRKLIQSLDVELDPYDIAGTLSSAEKQLTQIIMAIALNPKVLILDEPNAALTDEETAKLFRVLRGLNQAGVTIIYISHRLQETIDLCDRITVLRDGQHIATVDRSEANLSNLVTMIAGRAMTSRFPPRVKRKISSNEILVVENLSRKGGFSNVSFVVHEGEIVGLAGLQGCGRNELLECIAGHQRAAGNMHCLGMKYAPTNTRAAIDSGVIYLPPERYNDSIFPIKSISFNIVISKLTKVIRNMFISASREKALSDKYKDELNIVVRSVADPIASLSGGNQQKVVFARLLACDPKIAVLNEPTRGIDVNTKFAMYESMLNLASQGIGVIFSSTELEELMALSDRVITIYKGRIVGEFNPEETPEEQILGAMSGETCDFS